MKKKEGKMKIVIVGAGVVGEALCSELSQINNDVVLIEKNEDILNKIIEKNDVTGLAGNGASYENLLEAGVDSADIFIAVTEADELNIISCIIARKLGAKYTIARVRNPEYSTNMRFVREELGISMMINPEEEAAKTIMNTLKFPNAESVDTFFSNRANILELLIEKDSQLVGFQLKNLESHLKEKVIICIVERENNIIIPTGDFILAENDTIYVTGTNDAVASFYDKMGYKKSKDINSVMLIGGGTLSHYLLKRLIKEKKQVKVIEKEREIAKKLSNSYLNAIVVKGDETDQEFLLNEGIGRYDAVVSLTDNDEENMVLSMFAKSVNSGKIITRMNRTLLLPILEKYEFCTPIVPKRVISDIIIRVVRSKMNVKGSKMNTLHRFSNNMVEAIVFEINDKSKSIGIPLKDLEILPEVIIAGILRRDELTYPGGNDMIEANDKVMIITTRKGVEDFDDILG